MIVMEKKKEKKNVVPFLDAMMIAFFPRNIHWSSLLINSIWPPYRLKGLLRRVYFPWDRINWIKEEQSTSDSKDFIIPRDFLKQVSIKVWETTKKQLVYVTKPASSQCRLIFIIKFLFHDVSFLWHELFSAQGFFFGTTFSCRKKWYRKQKVVPKKKVVPEKTDVAKKKLDDKN